MTSRRPRVMVVDDDPFVLKVTKLRLESAGYEVSTRAEPLGTLKAVEDFKPDILLLDLRMPALTGDLVADLVKQRSNLAIVFQSSEPMAVLQKKVQATGALGAIAKTDDDRYFLAQFERLVARLKLSDGA